MIEVNCVAERLGFIFLDAQANQKGHMFDDVGASMVKDDLGFGLVIRMCSFENVREKRSESREQI